jgi:hypothetical protein
VSRSTTRSSSRRVVFCDWASCCDIPEEIWECIWEEVGGPDARVRDMPNMFRKKLMGFVPSLGWFLG